MYDVIIVGAGPTGMTAGIYTARKQLKTLIVSPNIGGQVAWTNVIENYPGIERIENGAMFAIQMKKQVKDFGVEFATDVIKQMVKTQENLFELAGENKKYQARAVIIATGMTHRRMNVVGEEKFTGRGVTYCAICDGPMFAGKDVVVVGTGNAGLQAAEFMLKICPKVYLLEMMSDYQGDKILVERIKKNPKLEFLPQTKIKEIRGDKFVNQVVLDSGKSLGVEGILVEIGYKAESDWLNNLIELNQHGEIVINQKCETSTPGIFAAGDATDVKYKQIIIACGAGAIAALSANDYLLLQ